MQEVRVDVDAWRLLPTVMSVCRLVISMILHVDQFRQLDLGRPVLYRERLTLKRLVSQALSNLNVRGFQVIPLPVGSGDWRVRRSDVDCVFVCSLQAIRIVRREPDERCLLAAGGRLILPCHLRVARRAADDGILLPRYLGSGFTLF